MLKSARLGPFEEVFSHRDDHGVIRHFAATRMYRHAMASQAGGDPIELAIVPLDENVAGHARKQGIEQWKVDRLQDPWLQLPGVGVQFQDGTVLLVDGNHRVVRLHRDGKTEFRVFLFQPGQWEPFLVDMRGLAGEAQIRRRLFSKDDRG